MSLKGIFPIDKWDFKSDSVITDLPPNELAILTANMTTQVYNKEKLFFVKEPMQQAFSLYVMVKQKNIN